MARVQYIDLTDTLEVIFLEKAQERLAELSDNQARIAELKRKIVNRAKRHIRARTKAGFDSDGNKFKPVKKTYRKYYQFHHTSEKKTNYASSSKSDDIQFTGQIFKNLDVKVKDVLIDSEGVTVEVEVGVKGARNKKIAKVLEGSIGTARNKKRYRKAKRPFLAISDSGRWGTQFEKEIIKTIENTLF